MKDILDLIGRLFLATIFFYEAYDTTFHFERTKAEMADHGWLWQLDFTLYGGLFLLIMGGMLLVLGYRTRLGVTLLLLYFVPITLVVYSWWNDPKDCYLTINCIEETQLYRREQGIIFMKNLAIIGGLLMVWVNGSGRYSIKRLFATTRVP